MKRNKSSEVICWVKLMRNFCTIICEVEDVARYSVIFKINSTDTTASRWRCPMNDGKLDNRLKILPLLKWVATVLLKRKWRVTASYCITLIATEFFQRSRHNTNIQTVECHEIRCSKRTCVVICHFDSDIGQTVGLLPSDAVPCDYAELINERCTDRPV